jgi:LPXTG-site transpeptidase (sortase) family protein
MIRTWLARALRPIDPVGHARTLERAERRRFVVGWVLLLTGTALAFSAPLVIRLRDDLAARNRSRETDVWVRRHEAPPGEAPPRTPRPAPPQPTVITPGREGYLLVIPRLGLRAIVRELEADVFAGRNTPTLKRYGLGQLPYTPQLRNVSPGGRGTAAITGHRTTSGAPFRHIDRLQAGDIIIIHKAGVEQRWAVVSSAIVPPSRVLAIESRPGTRQLVLLACTPPFTARERLLVYARLAHETASSSLAPLPASPE